MSRLNGDENKQRGTLEFMCILYFFKFVSTFIDFCVKLFHDSATTPKEDFVQIKSIVLCSFNLYIWPIPSIGVKIYPSVRYVYVISSALDSGIFNLSLISSSLCPLSSDNFIIGFVVNLIGSLIVALIKLLIVCIKSIQSK